MSNGNGQVQRRNHRNLWRISLGVLTMLLIVAVFTGLVIYRPPTLFVDSTSVTTSELSQKVSQTQSDLYCPARMALSDSGQYGDSEFQTSTGDMASSARYAAFGSVYAAQVTGISGDDEESEQLVNSDVLNQANVKVAGGNADKGSRIIDTRLLEAKSGTGSAGSIASWATTGDLQGLTASGCIAPELTQHFLLSETTTGTTQQLIVANTSAKATSVDIQIWGTAQTGTLTAATGSTLNVAAKAEATLDLAAAADKQQGLFVTVSSKETPVATVVRTVAMDGLKPVGSDFAIPTGSPMKTLIIPSLQENDNVSLIAYSAKPAAATCTWLGDGVEETKTVRIATNNKVVVENTGAVPQKAQALLCEASAPVRIEAKVTRTLDGKTDFAFIQAQAAARGISTVVVPDKVQADITLANGTNQTATATLHYYDEKGKSAGTREIAVEPQEVTRILESDMPKNAKIFTLEKNTGLIWGALLSQHDLTEAKVPSIAYLAPTSLEPQSQTIWANPDQSIVH